MASLPDDAVVIRGGLNLPESFSNGSGVFEDSEGKLHGISVNSAPGLSVLELTAPDRGIGFPGIPHKQIGVTTVGKIRAVGGDVTSKPSRRNPWHATLNGLTEDEASALFRPTLKNPSLKKR